MTVVRRSVLVPYTPEQMFGLVTDIPSYPEFLPWCKTARILSQDGDEVLASLGFSAGGLQRSFTTRNRHSGHHKLNISLVEGPFRHLEGFWRFEPLGDQGCKVMLDLEFDFANRMLGLVVGPVFTQIANTLVDSFQQRARQVYGKQ